MVNHMTHMCHFESYNMRLNILTRVGSSGAHQTKLVQEGKKIKKKVQKFIFSTHNPKNVPTNRIST